MNSKNEQCDVTILKEVGRGGLSKVYQGHDSVRNTYVAVKILDDMSGGLSKALWKKEVEGLSKLSNQNIVRIIDSCEKKVDDKSQFWIVLEWLEETLAERYARGAYLFTGKTWLEYSRSLINGLAYAHENNIAHRDIKPENLLFRTKNDTDNHFVIADFGISKNLEHDEHTRTVADYGSLVFSPPDHGSRDPFSRDVYSAAAVMVQLTTGIRFIDTLDIQKSLETSKLPESIKGLLSDSLNLDPARRPKNMIEFRNRFNTAIDLYQSGNKAPVSPALRVQVKFTKKAMEQLSLGFLTDFETAQEEFENAFDIEGVYAHILPPKDGSERTDISVSVCTDEWAFTFAVQSDFAGSEYLLLTGASKPDFDTLERYRFGGKKVDKAYLFIALDQRAQISANNGTSALLTELKRAMPESKDKETEPGSFESWGRVLEAREAHARGATKSIEYVTSTQDGKNITFTLAQEPEAILIESCWEIREFNGVYFEVISGNETQIITRPSREVGQLPKRGFLNPSIGRDAVSLSRQKAAVQAFISGESVAEEIRYAIENPEDAYGFSEIVETVDVINGLDSDKHQAVTEALATDDIFVVEGPPGTGKTNFIAELVHQIRRRDAEAKILLVAQTHVAVDNAMLRLEKSGFVDMLRIGDSRDPRLNPQVHSYLVEKKIKTWIEEIREFAEANLQSRAGIEGQGLERLKALTLLSQLSASRKNMAYLRNRSLTGTTALAAAVSEDDESKINDQLAEAQLWQEGLRNQLKIVSASVANRELVLSDIDLELLVQDFTKKFRNPEQLIKLLDVQTGWLLKIHLDEDLRFRFLSSAGLVAGTCVGFLRERAVKDMQFDFCIIDEASKATATETLVPMSKAKRVILVGDANQLPPQDEELLSDEKTMLQYRVTKADVETTLFDLLKTELPESKSITLKTQWRMSKAIGDLISECFYEGKLDSVNSNVIEGYSNLIGKQVKWLDTSKHEKRFEKKFRNGGYQNAVEARVIAKEVQKIAKAALSRHLKVEIEKFEILIVSPYRAQKAVIQEELRVLDLGGIRYRIETADAVQGSEADVVIVATTRSNSTKSLGFLDALQWRRINVALSRAKFGLVIVGDSEFVAGTTGGLTKALEYIRAHPETCEIVKVDQHA
jgi:serine/threonine protein kinase